ncbi:hypothetical protein [Butyrivibrio sp. YAB3001]|uniref:hypothetical protein n=1 Tax=Butyrivibrio sp. YAB3001 TaxID=1520812 RepID=UPI0008F624D4|nr:hypothetical protein [Butyrivibrio sp. YAB3001]SFB81610.1 hypothetical protein SAMN02910398_00721 [Butyrivibrio sp. YAB3001]
MGRVEYFKQLRDSIVSAKKNATITVDEATYGEKMLHELLPYLANRLDISVEVVFSFDNEKYKSRIPAGTVITRYIGEKNITNIDKLVEDFNGMLV